MKLRLLCLALALCALAPAAFADIAPPPQPVPTPTQPPGRRAAPLPAARMLIEARNDATEARLQIPRNMLTQLRAEMDRDSGTEAGATTPASASSGAIRTIIAGVFLSLSLAFAGITITRARSRHAKQAAVVALVACAAIGALAIKTFANIRPLESRTLDAGSLKLATTPDAKLNGVIRVEVVDEHNVFKLIVPAAPATNGSR